MTLPHTQRIEGDPGLARFKERLAVTRDQFGQPEGDWSDLQLDLAGVAATLPDCPTCGGTGEEVVTQPGMGETIHAHITCPDCVDGKVTVAQMAAVWARVGKFADEERHQHGGEYGEGWRACIDHLRAVRP